MADNRVVIKINLDEDKRKEVIDPRMVTVWHTGRILATLSILLVLIILLIWLSSDDEKNESQLVQTIQAVEQISPTAVTEPNQKAISPTTQDHASMSLGQRAVIKSGLAIIYDKRVIRASLNVSIKDDEPGQGLQSSVLLEPGKTQELFYFSETRNNKDDALFHQWLRDGRQVQKKQTGKQKSKFVSKQVVGQKDIGVWKALLIDKKGKVYSQVEFTIGLQ